MAACSTLPLWHVLSLLGVVTIVCRATGGLASYLLMGPMPRTTHHTLPNDPQEPGKETRRHVVRLHADANHETGEYAILLRSDLKGQGLGWELMRLTIEWARADGLGVIEGQVLRENTVMLDMACALGFKIRSDGSDRDLQIVTLRLEDAAIQRDT